MSVGIVWFRQDLRLRDNPALTQACAECDSVVCVFIDDPTDQTISQVGQASRVWLHHSLAALDTSLRLAGNALLLVRQQALTALTELTKHTGAQRVYWNRCYDPVSIARDKIIKTALVDYQPRTFNASLVFEPWENLKADGTPYRVYTPFWNAAARQLLDQPEKLRVLGIPSKIPALTKRRLSAIKGVKKLGELSLLPSQNWHKSMMMDWQVGENAALATLKQFFKADVLNYSQGRDLPGDAGTSRMSPHLHFGEISPRTVLSTLLEGRAIGELSDDEKIYAKEIVWREFAYCLIYHFPHTLTKPLDKRFDKFPWARAGKKRDVALDRWQRGKTGVPIVDAGMRELYATGWMHNRVRMIVASYLIKNLLIPWQQGENWFRDTLVDADIASNAMGWQWTAGCGADAAPFFRVFNPVLQGEKFDKQGHYVKRWLPELEHVPLKFLHKPWELADDQRSAIDYPAPLADLKTTRVQALAAFAEIKGTKTAL